MEKLIAATIACGPFAETGACSPQSFNYGLIRLLQQQKVLTWIMYMKRQQVRYG
jgi:hypothetical protein